MTVRLLVATRSEGKLRELRHLLSDVDVVLLSLDEIPEVPEVVEDGATFAHNAKKKAREVAMATGLPVLADDSGLEVDALGGVPGVFSARFAGPECDDTANNTLLLERLNDTAEGERTARFVCALAFAQPGSALVNDPHVEFGSCEGHIGREPRGDKGFGYDPIFIPVGERRTMAELTAEEKNARSHRAQAVKRMGAFLRRHF